MRRCSNLGREGEACAAFAVGLSARVNFFDLMLINNQLSVGAEA